MNCYQEVLVLLWKVMEENPVFTQYVLKHCDINEVGTDFFIVCCSWWWVVGVRVGQVLVVVSVVILSLLVMMRGAGVLVDVAVGATVDSMRY